MSRKLLWLIPLIFLLAVLLLYFYPGPQASFEETYANVDPAVAASLQVFRQENPPKQIVVDNASWEYLALGEGDRGILFLHGMTGAYDIWWKQIEALGDSYRLISVTYPPVDSLEDMAAGIQAILEQEGLSEVNLVGSSLGGYLAQYLVANHPEMVNRAVFANTFPPNGLIAEQNRLIGALLPSLPEWLVMSVLRGSFQESIYPASGYDELVLAYLMEISYGRMSKAQVVGRFHAVIDPFEPPDIEALDVPVMILEASNDPLVDEALREQLKTTYPDAKVVAMGDVGHFPYLNQAEEYQVLLRNFFELPFRFQGSPPAFRSSQKVAESYLSAILSGDREGALDLIRLEVLCSGAGMEEEVDRHLALFAGAETRNLIINIRDLTGSVAYSPGTEGAHLQFEYQHPGDRDWRPGEFGVAAVNYPEQETEIRYICWLWTAEE